MKLLSEKNHNERDEHISFQEEGHIYNIDNDETFVSTTTWVHQFFSKFDADKIIKKMMNSKKWQFSKYFGMTANEIKIGWNENGRLASEAGTNLHEDIEDFYNGISVNNDSVEYRYFKNFYNEHLHLIPYRTEWCIWDSELKLCGSIDMLFDNGDGTLSIYDWKRCKEIKKSNDWGERGLSSSISHLHDCNFYHYSLQLNIYKALLEKNYGLKVTELAIVCLHPDNDNDDYQKYIIPDLQKEVAELFKGRSEQINTVEVEEREFEGKIYLVDSKNIIYSDDGVVLGNFPPNI